MRRLIHRLNILQASAVLRRGVDTAGETVTTGGGTQEAATNAQKPVNPNTIAARWAGVAAAGLATVAIAYALDTKLLMPGPIATAHRVITDCATCHSNISEGQFGWVHSVVTYANPNKDSTACLSCHQLGSEALSPHGLPSQLLERTRTPGPTRTSVDGEQIDPIFAADWRKKGDVFCATCHKEHNGANTDLTIMSEARCHTCHQIQFDRFDTGHPEFKNYPFLRRSRIKFDHTSHFEKHFDETRSKQAELTTIPRACADCHTSTTDKRHMSVKPFAETCSQCHLAQIVGSQRASGPKGIALLSLPGLDLETLRQRKAPIGEWPEQSEAELTPLMKLLLSKDDNRRARLEAFGRLDLQDLTQASASEIAAVTSLVWQIKRLIHTLTTSKASNVMQRLRAVTGRNVSRKLMAQLIATMPRDVLVSAQREWLPSLKTEIAKRSKEGWEKVFRSPGDGSNGNEKPLKKPTASGTISVTAAPEPPPDRLVTNRKSGRWRVDVLGELVQEGEESKEAKLAAKGEIEDPPNSQGKVTNGDTDAADVTDTLEVVFDEQAVPAVDAESWTDLGGWYRQDFSILYRPTGHADPFIRAWLDFSGHHIGAKQSDPAAPVFDLLTHKDTPGQCIKCHSIEADPGPARLVQWGSSSVRDKNARFTRFVHEPHFRLLDDKGCLTCHEMSAQQNFAASYKSLDPQTFESNFKQVEKKVCAACHKANAARQDCKLCHTYHVTPVTTPITSTTLPAGKRNKIR